MVSIQKARQAALALPEVEESSHFERPDFRIRNKVFAVLHAGRSAMVLKLNPVDQSVFCAFDQEVICPVPGGWGRKGWTQVNLAKIRTDMFKDALLTAWKTVARDKLANKYFPGG